MSAGDILGYYTSERYAIEHISAIIQRAASEWSVGQPLCGRVAPRSVFPSLTRLTPLVELSVIAKTPPRLDFVRCPRCQRAAERLLSDPVPEEDSHA